MRVHLCLFGHIGLGRTSWGHWRWLLRLRRLRRRLRRGLLQWFFHPEFCRISRLISYPGSFIVGLRTIAFPCSHSQSTQSTQQLSSSASYPLPQSPLQRTESHSWVELWALDQAADCHSSCRSSHQFSHVCLVESDLIS